MAGLRKALIAATAGLALAACAPVALTLDTDLAALKGKAVVVYFGDELEILQMCAEWGVPGSLACVAMATSPEEKLRILHSYTQHMAQFGLDCVVLAPPSIPALAHELTLCAKPRAWYWNKSDPGA